MTNASRWQTQDPEHVVTWTPASPPRTVEGPLALDMFTGRLLVLELAPGQVAVHEVAGQARRVFLDARHQFDVGDDRDGLPPEGHLVFVRPDVPLRWRWAAGCELHVETARGQMVDLPLRGACTLQVDDPCRFHEAVIAGLPELDPDTLRNVFDTLVRSRLESHLHDLVHRGRLDRLQAKFRLEDLAAEDLDDDLAPQGLSCRELVVAVPLREEEAAPVGDDAPAIATYDDLL